MASTRDWFESVAEAQRRARKRVPKSVYLALLAGSEAGVTLEDNTKAFAELGFRPHIAGLPPIRDLSTTVLGQEISMPVICSPTGVQAVDPAGEVGVARGAAMSGTAVGLSSFGSKPIEEVVAANEKTFFQVYWLGSRDAMAARMDRARDAGAKGVIVTLDWVFATARDWGSPALPERIDIKTATKFAPQVLARPGWLLRFARSGSLPDLTTPNLVQPGQGRPTFFGAYGEWMGTAPPTWEDLAWLRQQWDGPFLIKGISHPDDAKRAVDTGATAISVSNHGGNNLDSTPAAIRLLPSIVNTVGGQVEILLDGGVRRGSDVVKALALGARAVMIGRPYLWGMAAAGDRGVHNVLEVLRQGIDSTLYGLGRSSVHELTPDDVLVPDGFTRGA
ncbi:MULTISPECIES: pre-mycofactocin synthase MftD [Nocardia]|uniref:pre-mycofactocin synthase MftD n=1 Tax=Nocardia TaxID=1817 RepID=UPI0007EB2174|nr:MULTISPECIES: pre-mycofactocin synthase MftD [Nocardia]MBF6278404.1 mycofactocin biosynthesis FMN-dependent deaminase MftD [Nocardia nova]OBA47852.1 alpha-hydroxy-acid oxidizing enzyme [Nocardia sp. 852002-51101_SCH5132738]OBB30248.1 alpha-hydroxy-acid oxidizing enzyme [Nocardia sp. 852002-51244_SCH5132740]OBF68009.1 alpha-hydroxy-acid oxidizing enzyme [Mycobacterium sp. 852002-51759_SCH5129042]